MGLALQLFKSVFSRPGPFADDVFLDRHLDSPLVAHLRTHPAIVAQVEPLQIDPALLPPGGLVLPIGWSFAETPANAIRPATAATGLPE
jgi:hypothetical protein